MPDTSDILDILNQNNGVLARKNKFHLFPMSNIPSIEDQAKQMYQGALKAPFTLPNTGSPWKDFAQQVMELGPLALRANIPNVKPPSAMDLSLQPGVKSNLGVTQPSGAGIAENANMYNPGVNPVLDFLSKESIPVNNIKDTPGGTTYIKASNPHAPNDNITIRVPNDQHIGTRGYRYNPGDLFDLGTKPVKGGGQKPNYTQNASGEKYGENPEALQDAIKYRFSKDLVSPGREPKSRLEKPENLTTTEHDPNQLDFNLETQKLHDLINEVTGKGMPEEPNYHPYNSADPSFNMEKPQVTVKEMGKMSKRAHDFNQFTSDPTEMVAANTGKSPSIVDPLDSIMNNSEAGKYQLAVMRQKLEKMGIDHKNMSTIQMFKALNPDLFK